MRTLAGELGVSVATVSLSLKDDARITAAVRERVKALAARRGYHADPVVAEGLSRARRRDFHRDTVAWLLDRRPEEQPWLERLFSAGAERGRVLGYRVEFWPLDVGDPVAVRRATRAWRARGIRGVVAGPFGRTLSDPPLPWDDFSWVAIGHSLISPALHRVGRDYDKDIAHALDRLHARGCRRPGFVDDPAVHHLMKLPLLRAALVYYHERFAEFPEPFCGVDPARPGAFADWYARSRPDSLVLGLGFKGRLPAIHDIVGHLPQVEISPPYENGNSPEGFIPNYAGMGGSAIGMLHRLLTENERGVPPHEQTVVVSSGWGPADVWKKT